MPALLRTKRSKRCAACKHILVKPDFKPTSTKYRIKLTALNYTPLITLKPLSPSKRATDGTSTEILLKPSQPHQFILTLKNHLFDPIKVSLATPATTPGKYGHRVTVLCPQFEVGSNGDVWEDALNDKDRKEKKAGEAAEAGKIHDKGRNWTSVVVEIVAVHVNATTEEDEDVIEIPIRVRLEWRQSDADEGGAGKAKSAKINEEGEDEARRELAYWMVLGVGRVAT